MRNESAPGARGPVFCGVDTHADSHWLCVLDWRGRKVLSRQFPADAAGYEALAGAIAAAGEPACVAMEGTSSYGAGLTRHLASLGMPVREALSPAGTQRRRPGQGKCDESDAERAARAAMSGSRLGTPKSQDGWVDGVRCMLAARSGAVKARTSAINTARSLLTTAPEGLRSRFRGMGGPRLMEELPSVRAEGALGAALDASELVAARRAAKVSQVRAASILGTSEKYISMLERGQRELKPIRRAYEAWVEAGLPLDWDRQAFEAERKMDSKKHLAK
ncbi:MAG: IS110 family transposase [Collinsella sp.]